MKIIKPGVTPETQIICSRCECEFEYDEHDVVSLQDTIGEIQYVKCPCCGKAINIYQPEY